MLLAWVYGTQVSVPYASHMRTRCVPCACLFLEHCLERGCEEVALIRLYPARTRVSVAKEFCSLMGLGIFVLRQTLHPGLPMRLLIRFSREPAWLFTFTSKTVPGHARSLANRGTSTSKCTISSGCGWKSDRPHFRRISSSTKQSMNTSRSAQHGNCSRALLRSLNFEETSCLSSEGC